MFQDSYDELISLEELCYLLQIGKSSAYRILQSKALKAFKIGKIWKIPKSSVNDFIREQCNKSFYQL